MIVKTTRKEMSPQFITALVISELEAVAKKRGIKNIQEYLGESNPNYSKYRNGYRLTPTNKLHSFLTKLDLDYKTVLLFEIKLLEFGFKYNFDNVTKLTYDETILLNLCRTKQDFYTERHISIFDDIKNSDILKILQN